MAKMNKVKQVNLCSCKGEVCMHTIFENGKVRHYAECKDCGATSRKPKELKVA